MTSHMSLLAELSNRSRPARARVLDGVLGHLISWLTLDPKDERTKQGPVVVKTDSILQCKSHSPCSPTKLH